MVLLLASAAEVPLVLLLPCLSSGPPPSRDSEWGPSGLAAAVVEELFGVVPEAPEEAKLCDFFRVVWCFG